MIPRETRPPEANPTPTARRTALAGRVRPLLPFALGLVGALAAFLVLGALDSDPEPLTQEDIVSAVASAAEPTPDILGIPARVYESIVPSLVLIRGERSAGPAGPTALGSGVVVNTDGSILTALHVVEGAEVIRVRFADGSETTATILEADPELDLATLLPDRLPEVIVPAVLGGGVRVGDQAFAVGNPLGLAASLSAGVISGLNRSIPLRSGGGVIEGLIQFDAAVNPGSSGGPLLNGAGQVVGIVTALANPTNDDSFTGIGFAVPISAAGGGGGPPR